MKTTIKTGDGHLHTIITRSDGNIMEIWFIGRCWQFCTAAEFSTRDYAGREIDEEKIVKQLRWEFARGLYWG